MTPENGKNDTKYDVSDFLPRDFFVGIVKLHKFTDFRTCT